MISFLLREVILVQANHELSWLKNPCIFLAAGLIDYYFSMGF
jgi:hypothetical protein